MRILQLLRKGKSQIIRKVKNRRHTQPKEGEMADFKSSTTTDQSEETVKKKKKRNLRIQGKLNFKTQVICYTRPEPDFKIIPTRFEPDLKKTPD